MNLDAVLNETFYDNDIRKYYVGKIINKKDTLENLNEKNIYEVLVEIVTLHEEYTSFADVYTSDDICLTLFNNIDENKIDLIKDLDINSFPIVLSARVYDFLWEKQHNINFAKSAIKKYLELFKLVYDFENWKLCLMYIYRATVIAAKIGKGDELYQECINVILQKLQELNGNDIKFLSIKLIELLEVQQYKDKNVLINYLDKIIQNSKSNNNISKIEEAYKLKLRVEKNQENKKIIKLEIAEFYEQYADNYEANNFQSLSSKIKYLKKAIHCFNEAGEKEKSNNAMKKLEQETKKTNSFLNSNVIAKIDISKHCNEIHNEIKSLNTKELITVLASSTRFYCKQDIEKEVILDAQNLLTNSLFSTSIVDDEGKVLITFPPLDTTNIQNDRKILELYMHKKLREKEEIDGAIILSIILNKIKENYVVQKEDIAFLIEDNCIIPKDREEIFIEGILKGLNGDYYTALHILAPQMENLFRNLAKELGGVVFTLENDDTSKVKVLSSVFEIEELNEGYDENILFIFKGLLNEQAGANIRNDVGHGILNKKTACSGIGKYFLAAVIKLCYITSKDIMFL